MASSKPDLSRAGTMEVTAKEGSTYLSKNLTDWKKPYLMPNAEEDEDAADDADGAVSDDDGAEDSPPDAPPTKKVRLSKAATMVGTAKEAKGLLAGEKLGDTRQETKLQKQRRASKLKRASTMAKAKQEAEAVYGGDLDLTEGRSLRKRARKDDDDEGEKKTKKTPMKKAGTMVATAKEGKAYLKRTKKAKKGKSKGKGKK